MVSLSLATLPDMGMTIAYFWIHTDRRTGKRRRTRYRLTEADALVRLLEPVRVDDGALPVEPVAIVPSGVWVSGLVRGARDDEALT